MKNRRTSSDQAILESQVARLHTGGFRHEWVMPEPTIKVGDLMGFSLDKIRCGVCGHTQADYGIPQPGGNVDVGCPGLCHPDRDRRPNAEGRPFTNPG